MLCPHLIQKEEIDQTAEDLSLIVRILQMKTYNFNSTQMLLTLPSVRFGYGKQEIHKRLGVQRNHDH